MIPDTLDKEKLDQFGKNLDEFLVKELNLIPERDCLMAGSYLIKSAIDVLYQNAPCIDHFEKISKALFDRILTMYMESLCPKEKTEE